VTTTRGEAAVAPPRELAHTPDLVELVGRARGAGLDAMLFVRPMPDAASVAGVGRRFEIVSTPGGAAVEDASGALVDREQDPHPLRAAVRLWARLAPRLGGPGPQPATGPLALGGFAWDPAREPDPPWDGFPAVLFRVPQLAVARVRGRTFAWGDEELLEPVAGVSAPPARHLSVEPSRPPDDWTCAVAAASQRMRAGEAAKVVLAREVVARADGVLEAAAVARALCAAYPSCFTYLVGGADGSAFLGASPELLLRRLGREAASQPMAGSIARGQDEAEDATLAARLRASAKDNTEHALTAWHVRKSLEPFAEEVRAGQPEIVPFTNIQHLATTVEATLRAPGATLLELAAGLHPTPAINGEPAGRASRLIRDLEAMERGWYAGAVGWLDGRGDGELAIAIRCGLLTLDTARLFAGNGIMPDSDPATELAETETKLRALLGALTA
jgi:isochorismate synthase